MLVSFSFSFADVRLSHGAFHCICAAMSLCFHSKHRSANAFEDADRWIRSFAVIVMCAYVVESCVLVFIFAKFDRFAS